MSRKRINSRKKVPLKLKKTKKKDFKKGIILIIIGVLVISAPTIFSRLNKIKTTPSQTSVVYQNQTGVKNPTISEKEPIKISKDLTKKIDSTGEEVPAKIIIPRLNIDLPVIEAKVVDGYWELSENTASFGLGSAFLGDAGNSVIFAHARDHLFGPLKRIIPKDKIYVLSKKHYFNYEVTEIKTVYPNQVEVVGPSTDERLTLFTCSGFFDSQRLIVVAKRI